MIMEEMSEAIEPMEANEPQANLYRAAEEYVSDLTRELVGIGDSDDFDVLVELMKQAVIYGAHWKMQQMMKDAVDIIPFEINPNNGVANFWIGRQYGESLTIKSSWIIAQGLEINRKVKLIIIKED